MASKAVSVVFTCCLLVCLCTIPTPTSAPQTALSDTGVTSIVDVSVTDPSSDTGGPPAPTVSPGQYEGKAQGQEEETSTAGTVSDWPVSLSTNNVKETSLKECKESLHLSSAGDGRIQWTGNGSAITCWWQIDVSSVIGSGLVLHFDQVALRRGQHEATDDTVTVFRGTRPDPSTVVTRVQGSLPISPVLLPSSQVLFKLQSYRQTTVIENMLDRSREPQSSFSISFLASPLNLLPPNVTEGVMVGRYNCSPPYEVPGALLCDKVEQCVDGEDERNCSYRHTLCGDWIPLQHRNLCFLLVFSRAYEYAADLKLICKSHGYGTELVELIDDELKRFVAEIVSLSGLKEVLVGLTRVNNDKYNRGTIYGDLYRFLWQWQETSYLELSAPLMYTALTTMNCAVLRISLDIYFRPVSCQKRIQAYMCMRPMVYAVDFIQEAKGPKSGLEPVMSDVDEMKQYECSDRSFTYFPEICLVLGLEPKALKKGGKGTFNVFQCNLGNYIRYSDFCNGVDDCSDGTDENGCGVIYRTMESQNRGRVSLCADLKGVFPFENECDGIADCVDQSDEISCRSCRGGHVLHEVFGCVYAIQYELSLVNIFNVSDSSEPDILTNDNFLREVIISESTIKTSPRSLVLMYGFAIIYVHSPIEGCPDGHFQCHSGLCIPSYLVNNQILNDCPIYRYDDEFLNTSEVMPCPGYFRCNLRQCIMNDFVCDGIVHCYDKEDEQNCFECPPNCTCYRYEYKCEKMFEPTYGQLFVRYLDFSHVFQPSFQYLHQMVFLHYLNFSFCHLKQYKSRSMPKLTVLDLSFNEIEAVSNVWISSRNLKYLDLSNNPFLVDLEEGSFKHIANQYTGKLNTITWLSLRNTSLYLIEPRTFTNFSMLKFLDISGNPMRKFTKNMFTGLSALSSMVTDDLRFCCAYRSEYSSISVLLCQAPEDELSSCEDLLRSGFLRVTLWVQSIMAMAENLGVFVFRVFLEYHKTPTSFRVLIINLCVADLLMGVYLMIIGAADAHFLGQYVWKQSSWTDSVQCTLAGLMALTCSEMSAFIICIVTIDRLLVLRFPFKRHWHLSATAARVACAGAWTIALMLALLPLLPAHRHWSFYSQTGICLPLPITRRQYPGAHYSFAIFIVLNFLLFLFISLGQVFNFITIHNTPTAGRTDRHQQDMAIARRLFLIVFTDFCVWFPVGIMGLLAARGMSIPGQVNVWTAVFVLPLNSVLNPLLYSLNVLREKRQRRIKERWTQNLIQKMRVDMSKWPAETVLQILRCCESVLKTFSSANREDRGEIAGVSDTGCEHGESVKGGCSL